MSPKLTLSRVLVGSSVLNISTFFYRLSDNDALEGAVGLLGSTLVVTISQYTISQYTQYND